MKEKLKIFKDLIDSQLFKRLQDVGGEVFFVGGCVRDVYLNRNSKDIDIIVRCVVVDALKEIMSECGKFELVGESFGVFKYKDNTGFELDIAIPRKDSKGEGRGHKSIDAQSDPFLPLIEDLSRRDFTFNAMAFDTKMNLIDPFKGKRALKEKIVKPVSMQTFLDDPLRIARFIRFAAVFQFQLEEKALELVKKNIDDLTHIPGERKLEELEKIAASKVAPEFLLNLLRQTNSTKQLFGHHFLNFVYQLPFETVDELLFVAGVKDIKFIIDFLKLPNTADNRIVNRLKAFNFLDDTYTPLQDVVGTRQKMFDALQIAKDDSILDSPLLAHFMHIQCFKNGSIPTNKHKIAMKGEDFIALGIKGTNIGVMQRALLTQMFMNEVTNDREAQIEFVKTNLI